MWSNILSDKTCLPFSVTMLVISVEHTPSRSALIEGGGDWGNG
jgi:hypothetical protein